MARFVFKLQALLELRRRQEQVYQRALAELTQARSGIEDLLRRHQHRISEQKLDMRDRLVGAIDTAELRQHAHAAIGVMREAQTAAIELAGLVKRQTFAREELVTAQAQRRAVELIRERRLTEWRLEQDRREVADLDDLVCSSVRRKEITA
jgi:flagellar export protein FliJ